VFPINKKTTKSQNKDQKKTTISWKKDQKKTTFERKKRLNRGIYTGKPKPVKITLICMKHANIIDPGQLTQLKCIIYQGPSPNLNARRDRFILK
jgi:hypothetical protein